MLLTLNRENVKFIKVYQISLNFATYTHMHYAVIDVVKYIYANGFFPMYSY